MKKLIAILLVVLLAFAGVTGYYTLKNRPAPSLPEGELAVDGSTGDAGDAAAPAETGETAEEGYGITFQSLDRDALYALHEPDEIVALVNGRGVTWDEYFYWLSNNASSVENNIWMAALYGGSLNWTDPVEEGSDETLLDSVFSATEESVRTFAVFEDVAEEYDVAFDEKAQTKADEELLRFRVSVVTADGTDEEFDEYLNTVRHIKLDTLKKLIRDSVLYQDSFTAIYGENGALVSDEDAVAWLETNGYIMANHILRLTKDMDTGTALDETAAAQKQAEASAIAAKLQAVKDPEKLLEQLAELKETWDEDTGKTENPGGYLFVEGEMVEEFYNAAKELDEYQVSDPVLSQFGYHVIVRLPLDPDYVLGYSGEGTPISARGACANEAYNTMVMDRIEQAELVYAEGFERPDLTAYLVEESF